MYVGNKRWIKKNNISQTIETIEIVEFSSKIVKN